MADLAPPPAGEAPPPTYAPSQPQILITPLPDAASFFWGQTVQGEVFVKGLGALRANGVRSLYVRASSSYLCSDSGFGLCAFYVVVCIASLK
jgi:hypothetical protein